MSTPTPKSRYWNRSKQQWEIDARKFCNLPRYCRCGKPADHRLGKMNWCKSCGPKT